MADTDKKSASSHEYKGDAERGSDIDLNQNVSAKSARPPYRQCRVLAAYPFFV